MNAISPINYNELTADRVNQYRMRQAEPQENSVSNKYDINPENSTTDSVNFKGNEYYYNYDEVQTQKKKSPLPAIGAAVLIAAGTIAGLGFAHKKGAFNGESKFMQKFAEPVGKKCHEWCSWIKKQGTSLWEKIKNLFSKKS